MSSSPSNSSPSNFSRSLSDATALRTKLGQAGFGTIEVVEQTTSTNSVLADQVRQQSGKIADFTVLLAEEQTQGRGRLNRSWSAPKASQLITSVAVRLPGFSPASGRAGTDPGKRLGLLPLLTGISVATAVRNFSARHGKEIPATLKWPNDVQVDGKKLAGILVEAVQLSPEPVIIIGFGLNFDLDTEELPVPHATSLFLEGMPTVSTGEGIEGSGSGQLREELATDILLELKTNIERFRQLGGAAQTVLPRYKKLSATLGTRVNVHLPNGEITTGTATGINDAGELIVAPSDGTGQELVVAAGDVTHLRPAGSES